jgi:hypothetical protein
MDGQLLLLLGAGSVIGALVGYLKAMRQFEKLCGTAARRSNQQDSYGAVR